MKTRIEKALWGSFAGWDCEPGTCLSLTCHAGGEKFSSVATEIATLLGRGDVEAAALAAFHTDPEVCTALGNRTVEAVLQEAGLLP